MATDTVDMTLSQALYPVDHLDPFVDERRARPILRRVDGGVDEDKYYEWQELEPTERAQVWLMTRRSASR